MGKIRSDEMAAEPRMSPKSIQRAYRKEEIPVEWLGRMARFDLAKVRRAMEKKAKALRVRENRDILFIAFGVRSVGEEN